MSIVKKRFRDPDSGGKISPLIIVDPTVCVGGIAYVKGRDVPGNAYSLPRDGTKRSVVL